MRMRELALDLSLAQILPEEIDRMLSQKKHGFIDVNESSKCIGFVFLCTYSEYSGTS